MEDYDIEKLVSNLDFESGKLTYIGKGMYLTNREVQVLDSYNIEYKKCNSLKEVIYLIEKCLDEEEFDDSLLDYVCSSIQERDYYQNTNK